MQYGLQISFFVSNFDNALFVLSYEEECIFNLDRYPTAYFHERVLWRLSDLQITPYILANLAAGETNPVRI